MLTNTTVALKPNFMSSLILCAVFLYKGIFSITFHTLVKYCLLPYMTY